MLPQVFLYGILNEKMFSITLSSALQEKSRGAIYKSARKLPTAVQL